MAVSYLCMHTSQLFFSFLGIDFAWTLTTNLGAAWGMFTQSPDILFSIRLIFIGILLGIYSISKQCTRVALLLILAGATSNIIDTIVWGHVIDMVHIRFWGWDYPVFNLADTYICIGAAYLIWKSFLPLHEQGKKNEKKRYHNRDRR